MNLDFRLLSASITIFLSATFMPLPAQATISSLTTTASGPTVADASVMAQRILSIQCDLMFGALLGDMEISDIVEGEEEAVFYLTAQQPCNH